jgi:hypothetical protein
MEDVMTWIYNVAKKSFTHNGKLKFYALYAGATGYKDNTDYECEINKGPLPRGKYRIIGVPFTHAIAGAYTLRLKPDTHNEMCGRAGFLIHGDSRRQPGEASNGCIVLALNYRKNIWDSKDKEVIVE